MSLAANALRAAGAWLFTALFWILFVPAHLLSFRALPAAAQAGLFRWWGRSALAILGVRVERLNACSLDDRQARVVICNHLSTLDLLWGASICPPDPLVIGKKELIYIPILNLIWWAMRFIRIDRGDSARAVASLQGVADEILSDGRTLVVAPEGTRSASGELLPFKKGAFHIAIQAQVPIYPVVVDGPHELMPKGRFTARPGVIRMRFLEPIPTRGLERKDVDSLISLARSRMQAELDAMKVSSRTSAT